MCRIRIFPAALLAAAVLLVALRAAGVDYQVAFQGQWNPNDHPTNYPSGAHFSPPILGVHNDNVSFWDIGGSASSGIEQMAEIGAVGPLRGIIDDAIAAGDATHGDSGPGSLSSVGSHTFDISVSAAHPLVTWVSMVAPSPDWFVGVSGIDLRSGNQWVDDLTVDLYAHDAGTEDGTDFSLSNLATVPQGVITRLHGPSVVDQFPFVNQPPGQPIPPLGTLTFTRIITLLEGDANNDGAVTAEDLIAVQQNFGAVGPNGDGTDPGDADDNGVVTADDLISAQQNFGCTPTTPGCTVTILEPGAPAATPQVNSGSSTVPEPGSILLLGAAVLSILGRGRRSRGSRRR